MSVIRRLFESSLLTVYADFVEFHNRFEEGEIAMGGFVKMVGIVVAGLAAAGLVKKYVPYAKKAFGE
jgi:hypothetical protein